MRHISPLTALALFLMLASPVLAGTGTITIYGTNATNADTNATAAGTDNNIQVTAWGVGDVAHTFRINVVNASDTLSFIIGNFTPGRIIEIKVNGTAYNGFQATDDGELRFTRTQPTSNQTYTLTTALTESGRNATWGFFYDLHMLNGTVENVNVVSTKHPLPKSSMPANVSYNNTMKTMVYVYPSTDQLNLVTDVATKITLGTERYDSLNEFSGSTWTATQAGNYTIYTQILLFNMVDNSYSQSYIYQNGTAISYGYGASNSLGYAYIVTSTIRTMVVGDTIEFYASSNTAGNVVDVDAARTFMYILRNDDG